ncbi:hypothetical protein ACWCY1_08440 [Streptomyces goshikiensis]
MRFDGGGPLRRTAVCTVVRPKPKLRPRAVMLLPGWSIAVLSLSRSSVSAGF